MTISSCTGPAPAGVDDASASTRLDKSAGIGTVSAANGAGRPGRSPACPAGANALYSYPWLIERISQTFFREWIGAHIVPTKIDHADWLCTMCGDYTATWETRSGSYCRYCWSLGRTVSISSAPTYMLEMIPLDGL